MSGETRVMQLAAESREASPWNGAARPRPTLLSLSKPIEGVELDTIGEEDCRGERSGTVCQR
jgi:hypothetical protein